MSKPEQTDEPIVIVVPDAEDQKTTDAPVEPDFSWDNLAAPVVLPKPKQKVQYSGDVIAAVPATIRERVEKLLAVNVARVAATSSSTAARPRVDYEWYLQPVPDKERAESFSKLVAKYCRNRPSTDTIPFRHESSPLGPITVRFAETGYYKTLDDGDVAPCASTADKAMLCVRYSARQFQARSDSN